MLSHEVEEIKKYIEEQNPPDDKRDALGCTLLMRACYFGELEIVRLLLDSKANPNLCDNSSFSVYSHFLASPELKKNENQKKKGENDGKIHRSPHVVFLAIH